jgi:hypothetical protein
MLSSNQESAEESSEWTHYSELPVVISDYLPALQVDVPVAK